jgi:hypothetical protein
MKLKLLRRQTRMKICQNKIKELQVEIDKEKKGRNTSKQLLNKLKKIKLDSKKEKKKLQKLAVTPGERGASTGAQDLVSIIRKSGIMFQTNAQGQEEFSPLVGVTLRALLSDAGISWNKMALVYSLVATSMVGEFDGNSFNYVMKNAGMCFVILLFFLHTCFLY